MKMHELETQVLALFSPTIPDDSTVLARDGIIEQHRIIKALIESMDGHGTKVSVDRLTRDPEVRLDYSSEFTQDPFFSVDFRIPAASTAGAGAQGAQIAATAFNTIRDFCEKVNREIAAQFKDTNVVPKDGNALDFAMKARQTFGGIDFRVHTRLGVNQPYDVRNELVRDALILGCEYRFLQPDTKYVNRGDDVGLIELSIRFYGNVQ